MTGLPDFFNTYFIMDISELLIGYNFFIRFLGKKPILIHSVFLSIAVFLILRYLPGGETGRLMIFIGLFFCAGRFFSEGRFSLFYSFVVVAVIHLCNGIVNSLCGILSADVIISKPERMLSLLITGSFFLSLFLILLCFKLVEKCAVSDETGQGSYGFLFLFPILLILLVSEYIGSELSSSTVTIAADRIVGDINYIPLLSVQVLGLVSLLGIVYACKKLQDGFRLQKRISLMEQESCFMHQYVEEAQMRYEKTRSFRHDIRNHIIVVEELLQKNTSGSADGGTARQYLDSMQKMSDGLAFSVSTGRPVLDILLGNKLKMAEELQISTECSLTVPDHCQVSDIDFCILLFNALDNAITACSRIQDKRQRFIEVRGSRQGAFLLLEVINSYDPGVEIRWGTGLGNIRAVAEKYYGIAETGTEEGVFTLSVLINTDC